VCKTFERRYFCIEISQLLFLLFLLSGKKKKIEGAELSSEKEGTTTTKKKRERFNNTMGFLGLGGRKKKSEAELAEEERLKRANMPWYARMFGMDSCCGNRKELKKSKDNNNTTNGASSMD
tara:strand:- start:23 stop:385 length:363 start_codon:yes stop_codon:yes gene_type:complete